MDLHGPLPPTREGYWYWLTFIDDASHRAATSSAKVLPLKDSKSTRHLWRTNSKQKIKELQDNKGGEFMSNAFIQFTDDCGIHRQHTTHNRPQPNVVAESANRTMGEDISAMLNEAQLPPSLWGDALNAQIHTWNITS